MGIGDRLILLDDENGSVDQESDASENQSTNDSVVALYRIESSIAAQKLQVLADTYRAAEARGDADLEWFTDTLAVEAGSSIRKVGTDLALALQLTESLPKTLVLLAAGELDLYRVRKIADAASALTPELCAVLEERIYPDVLDTTTGKLLRRVNRGVAELDPGAAEQRREKSRADRHVWCEPEPHTGMGWLTAYLPGDDLAAISKRLDTLATSNNDGVRTMDQRRADALRDLLLHMPTSTASSAPATSVIGADFSAAVDKIDSATTAGRGAGVAATIYVTVSAETLLGLDQRAGELRGYGPITAEHARDIAYRLQSEWVGVLIDDNGRAVTMTRNAYRFRGRLAELIRLRDNTCTHPGCDRPADRCDIDHLIPWPRGQTTPTNASTECRRHHRQKTLTDWTVSRKDDQFAWQKLGGQIFTTPIEPLTTAGPVRNRANAPDNDPPPF